MANAPRWRYGSTNPRKLPWKVAYNIDIGDAVFLDSADTVTPPDQSATVYPAKSAADMTWQTAITDPVTAPTVAANATPLGPGFTVAGAGFKVAYSYVTPEGLESIVSSLSAAMSTNNNGIDAELVAAVPTGVAKVRWYVTTDGGAAGTLRLVGETSGSNGIAIGGPPASDAAQPVSATQVSATALSQAYFAKRFAGISSQYYGGEAITSVQLAIGVKDGYFRANSGGVFDFDCASATFNEGDLVGMAKASGNNLENQKVEAVLTQAQAIGKVVQAATATTTVRVEIFGQKSLVARPTILN